MLDNNSTFKYETPYKGTFEITHFWINGAVTLQCVAIKSTYNIIFTLNYIYLIPMLKILLLNTDVMMS